MKFVNYNIRFGLGIDQKIDLGRIVETVQDADIISLQEVDRFWKRSHMTDQPKILARRLKGFYWVYFPAFDMDASTCKSDGTIVNRRRQFGPMLLSRWPILSSRSIVFPKLGTVDIFNIDMGALECVIDTPSGPLRVYSVHLSSVSKRERLMQLDHFLKFYRSAHVSGGAWTGDFAIADEKSYDQNWSNSESLPPMPIETIVMGDFNCEPDSEEYERMVGSIDPCHGRAGHLDSFVDSWEVAKSRSSDCITWWPDPVDRMPGYGLRIDYCFVDPTLSSKIEKVWVDQDDNGSDHRPLWMELNF